MPDTSEPRPTKLTRAGRAADSAPLRRLVAAAALGLVGAAGVLLVAYSLTRPADPPPPPIAAEPTLPQFLCDVENTPEGQDVNCEVKDGNDTDRLSAAERERIGGDALVDGPIVTDPQSDTYPEVEPGDGQRAEGVDCLVSHLQQNFTPEEFQLYADGQDGPRAGDWTRVTLEANEACGL